MLSPRSTADPTICGTHSALPSDRKEHITAHEAALPDVVDEMAYVLSASTRSRIAAAICDFGARAMRVSSVAVMSTTASTCPSPLQEALVHDSLGRVERTAAVK